MTNAVSSLSESLGAATAAPFRASNGDDVQRRRSLPAKLEVKVGEVESAVVAISSEGARRAQAAPVRQAPQTPLPAPSAPQQAVPEADTAPISLPGDSQIDAQADAGASAEPVVDVPISKNGGIGQQVEQDLSTPNYDEADTNQDGAVDVMERKIYDFNYPTLDGKQSVQAEASAIDLARRQTLVELKAYEDVARSGRTF